MPSLTDFILPTIMSFLGFGVYLGFKEWLQRRHDKKYKDICQCGHHSQWHWTKMTNPHGKYGVVVERVGPCAHSGSMVSSFCTCNGFRARRMVFNKK